MNATSTTSVNFAPKHLSGIDVIDDAWGGLYRGGSYLVYGRAASGRGLLTLMFARTGAAFSEPTLLVSPDRQKDLMIQAASIGFNLREAHDSGIVRLLRVPPLMNLQNMGDDGVSKALWDLVTLIRRHRPTRLIMNDFMPFVAFRSFDRFRNEFIQFLEQIDSLDTTTLLVMPEPANPQSSRVIEFMASQMTGSIHIELAEDSPTTTKRRISLIPHIGHIKRQVVDYWDLEDLIQTSPGGYRPNIRGPQAHVGGGEERTFGPIQHDTVSQSVADVGFSQGADSIFESPAQPMAHQAPSSSRRPGVPPVIPIPGFTPSALSQPPFTQPQAPSPAPSQPPYSQPQAPSPAPPQPPYSQSQAPSPAPPQPATPYYGSPAPQANPYGTPPPATGYQQAPPTPPVEVPPAQPTNAPTNYPFSTPPADHSGFAPGPETPSVSPVQPPSEPFSSQPMEMNLEMEYTNREAFREKLQQQFSNRDVLHQPFLLLALRMDRSAQSAVRPFDFDFLMDLVGEELRPNDDMLANIDMERLVVYLADSRPEEAQSFFTRLKDRLRQESPMQADHLLHSVSAIVVPDGRPFQNASEFLTYALDEA